MNDDAYSSRAPLGGILRAWLVVSFCAVLLGGVYPFGCAAFDHAGKRHAYSMPVFRLVVQE